MVASTIADPPAGAAKAVSGSSCCEHLSGLPAHWQAGLRVTKESVGRIERTFS